MGWGPAVGVYDVKLLCRRGQIDVDLLAVARSRHARRTNGWQNCDSINDEGMRAKLTFLGLSVVGKLRNCSHNVEVRAFAFAPSST